MANELRLSVSWHCPGDELSPHKWVVLRFYNDQMERERSYSLKDVFDLFNAQPPLSRQILREAWQALLNASMVAEGDEEMQEVLRLIDRALTFALAETSAQFFTRRTMLQVFGSEFVVVRTAETGWTPKKVEWRADL